MALPSGGSIRRGEIHARARARARVCVCVGLRSLTFRLRNLKLAISWKGRRGGEESGEEAELPLPASRGTLANNCWYSLMIFD